LRQKTKPAATTTGKPEEKKPEPQKGKETKTAQP